MNDKKICFVTSVNNERTYCECLKYIEQLLYPSGFSVEAIGIRDAISMTSAYNEAIERSDAKYKIYLHQDVFIINKNFVFDMIKLFRDESIGLIGMVGGTNISANGVWWEGVPLAGAVYDNHTGKMELTNFQKSDDKDYTKVSAVDGLCICTQYDIKWREDLFDGWHFYDASQCMEFARAGYSCVVPNQDRPWCIHDCDVTSLASYEKYKLQFIDEYLDN